jgi:hypothetical protein
MLLRAVARQHRIGTGHQLPLWADCRQLRHGSAEAIRGEGTASFPVPDDAFNVFNHTDFSGYNAGLNFNSYPTNANAIVTGLPTITPTALGRNANGAFNVTGFGTVTQTSPGALGYSRILQTLIRVTF